MNFPGDLRYTSEHEWVRVEDDGTVTMGITDYAQDALGDIVYVSLPSVGSSIERSRPLGEVESTKSVSEVYAPCSGEVVAVNADLADNPEQVNSDPYGQGWMARIRLANPDEIGALMDAAAYQEMVGSE